MSTDDLLDPEIGDLVRSLPVPDLDDNVLRDMRAFTFPGPEPIDPVSRQEMVVPGTSGSAPLPVTVYAPAGRSGPLPGVLAIHGGGYVMGDKGMYDGVFDLWCLDPGVVGVSVEYRRAPETPYPGALDDCFRAFQWMFANADVLGIDPFRIGVYGASAGGGLAAALALLARDRDDIDIAFQLLQYPMIDDRQATPSSQINDLRLWSRRSNEFGWRAYLGNLYGTDDIPSYAAPARAEDLANLPPTYICVGALDGFRDEDIVYAQRLLQAGVPTELHVLPGAPHGFDSIGGSAIARLSDHNAHDWIRRQLR